MTAKASRELLALAGIVVVLTVALLVWRRDMLAGPDTAPATPARTAAAAGANAAPVSDVRLELLESRKPDLEPPTRNPFQFRQRVLPPAPVRPVAAGGRPPVVVGPPPPPPGPPPLPPIALKYIGVLETAQGKVAVFRDVGGEIVNGGEGDIIDGRYRLLTIGVESADLAYVDGRGRQTIRLSGQ